MEHGARGISSESRSSANSYLAPRITHVGSPCAAHQTAGHRASNPGESDVILAGVVVRPDHAKQGPAQASAERCVGWMVIVHFRIDLPHTAHENHRLRRRMGARVFHEAEKKLGGT